MITSTFLYSINQLKVDANAPGDSDVVVYRKSQEIIYSVYYSGQRLRLRDEPKEKLKRKDRPPVEAATAERYPREPKYIQDGSLSHQGGWIMAMICNSRFQLPPPRNRLRSADARRRD